MLHLSHVQLMYSQPIHRTHESILCIKITRRRVDINRDSAVVNFANGRHGWFERFNWFRKEVERLQQTGEFSEWNHLSSEWIRTQACPAPRGPGEAVPRNFEPASVGGRDAGGEVDRTDALPPIRHQGNAPDASAGSDERQDPQPTFRARRIPFSS